MYDVYTFVLSVPDKENMKRKILLILLPLLFGASYHSAAEEGMWIPILLNRNIDRMQAMGLKLSAEDIYSINHSSLKDAIVMFGRGCTGEIVSPEGLLLTNHHCGYGSIQSLSTLERDILTDGYWAAEKSKELPVKGLTVTLLVRMEDVTAKTLEGVTEKMTEKERSDRIRQNATVIVNEAVKGTQYEASIKPFYNGNQYYLFVTEVFKDVRLVGAPPSSIGKFGGDTDNWMWPRHTGDFSVFRIYAGKDNKPADYSPDNVPYKPNRFLPVSVKGYDQGDFTFVFGYPGTTREYVPAAAVDFTANKENVARIALREIRLGIIGGAMDTSRLIRIQYANKYAGIANYWKKMIGESRGIRRLDAVKAKQEAEQRFVEWTKRDSVRNMKYAALLKTYNQFQSEYEPAAMIAVYLSEAGMAPEITRLAGSFTELVKISREKNVSKEDLAKEVAKRISGARDFYRNYNSSVDLELMKAMLPEMTGHIPAGLLPDVILKYSMNPAGYAEKLYAESLFADSSKLYAFLRGYKASAVRKILKDPGYLYARSVSVRYEQLLNGLKPVQVAIDSLQRIYMAAQMEMQPDRRFYPDANSTLRISYGKVDDYSPADAVTYSHFTTSGGILAKEDPEIYDYAVDPKLKMLLQSSDFGRYADRDGTLHVAFTASNHTTGGNSGSPVLNSEGHLIGLNFDRNWEGTMSDLVYDPDQCRNITLDIRYCLFIIDRFAGAGHLLEEMTIVE